MMTIKIKLTIIKLFLALNILPLPVKFFADSMDKIPVIIKGIEYKTIKIIEKLNQLAEENKKLKTEVQQLKNQIENKNKELTELTEKNNILKIANTVEGTENKTKVKLKINELLREVDRCLALLNK